MVGHALEKSEEDGESRGRWRRPGKAPQGSVSSEEDPEEEFLGRRRARCQDLDAGAWSGPGPGKKPEWQERGRGEGAREGRQEEVSEVALRPR